MAWRVSSIRQLLWIYRRAVFFSLICAVLIFYNCLGLLAPATLESIKLYENLELEKNDADQTCQLPLHHPFEPEAMAYFKPPHPVRCRSNVPMLTFVDTQGFLRFNLTAFQESGYSINSLSCKYQNIWRGADDSKIVWSDEKPVTGYDKPESDFFFVSCSRANWLPNTYTMYHASVQQDPQVREFEDDEEVGVAVVGLDSVSRLNFMRQLPRSYIALTQILGAVVFKGFNKVGFNTFPNLIPILMGSPSGNTSDTTTFDDWPLLWKPLKADGVATLYGEDMSIISTFSWWGAGFQKNPTNHYFRRFWLAVDHSTLNALSSTFCLGPVPKHRIYLDYLLSFLRTYKKSPQFMFSLENEASHDYMNTVGVMDIDLEKFLLTAHAEGLLNRTVLFVLADHGNRMDVFRQTHLGLLEDFMPMVSMVVPPWLAKKHPDLMSNLALNTKRLTSSYDLFSTFTDIFNRRSFSKKMQKYNFPRPLYGQSLFQPVPLERTCADAGIPEMFCICKEDSQSLESTEPVVQKSIDIILDYMNNQVLNGSSFLWRSTLQKYTKAMNALNKPSNVATNVIEEKCSKLKASSLEKAELFFKPDGRKIVFLKYRTSPNDGLYEGRVQWSANGLGSIHEEITRTNRYGDQADCLPKELLIILPFLRSACYCV